METGAIPRSNSFPSANPLQTSNGTPPTARHLDVFVKLSAGAFILSIGFAGFTLYRASQLSMTLSELYGIGPNEAFSPSSSMTAEQTQAKRKIVAFAANELQMLAFSGVALVLSVIGNQEESPQKTVTRQLKALITKWDNDPTEIATFINYFTTNKMWGTREARSNPAAFAEKQLNLLAQMNDDPALRKACFALAAAGSSDCQDNAYAMFHQMQEKALEIGMCQPGVPAEQLITYGLALENQAKLKQLIENTPELKKGIDGGEGTEALLALQLLCHQQNIILPVPVTSMHYEGLGVNQFKGPEHGWFSWTSAIKYKISTLIENAIPQHGQPSLEFLATQKFWQEHVNRTDPAIREKIAIIETTATEKLDRENLNLGNDRLLQETGRNMRAIEQERKTALANLYLDETERLLEIQRGISEWQRSTEELLESFT